MAKKTHGTARLACRNHPTYRWTQTKYSLPGEAREYFGRGVLMFDGEEGGKPASAFNMSERSIRERGPAFEASFREHYTPECDCPAKDLVFLEWADETIPTQEEANAFIEELGNRITRDSEFA